MHNGYISIPVDDVLRLIKDHYRENSNIPFNPESINFHLAERQIKELALKEIFPPSVAIAHIDGMIHLHDLGCIVRPYCSAQNPTYIAKFGLPILNVSCAAKPAKHPETFVLHLIKFSSMLQIHFAGAIGWDAVNIYIAPYLRGLSYKDIKQVAQLLIFEGAQQNVSRGGQSIFLDINLYWNMPEHYANSNVVFGGKVEATKYGELKQLSKDFLKAMLEIYIEGEGKGRPFFFPKPLLHITKELFKEPDYEEFLELASQCTVERGNPYFVFERGNSKISECCRLSFNLQNNDIQIITTTPWRSRHTAMQNITINLPQIAIKSRKPKDFVDNLNGILELACRGHVAKGRFIKEIYHKNPSPLGALKINLDGKPYFVPEESKYLIGLIGLDDAMRIIFNQGIADNPTRAKLLTGTISKKVQELKRIWGLDLVLEQTPAENAAYRLAELDKANFTELKEFLGDRSYYINSTQIPVESDISIPERIKIEGELHPLIEGGAISHIFLDDHKPDPKLISKIVKQAYQDSNCAQLAITPEFTECKDCGVVSWGYLKGCPDCHSEDLDFISRVTGYFSKFSGWNEGKQEEFYRRRRYRLNTDS